MSMAHAAAVSRARAFDLLALTKPRLSLLVLVSAAVGMLLAPSGPPPAGRAVVALLAIAAVVGGANTLNCYRERDSDARMRRTRGRPLPAGRLEPHTALALGSALSAGGVAALGWIAPLAGVLAASAVAIYVFLYTPLKRSTPLCTLVGAVPGAIPPMLGWIAASGRLELGAWILFAWLFLWQPPHFLALATLYRDDYRDAGMPMLPVRHPEDGIVERQMVLYIAALVPLPLLLVSHSRAGALTLIVTPIAGLAYLLVALLGAARGGSPAWARLAFITSILYMGISLLALAVDAGSAG